MLFRSSDTGPGMANKLAPIHGGATNLLRASKPNQGHRNRAPEPYNAIRLLTSRISSPIQHALLTSHLGQFGTPLSILRWATRPIKRSNCGPWQTRQPPRISRNHRPSRRTLLGKTSGTPNNPMIRFTKTTILPRPQFLLPPLYSTILTHHPATTTKHHTNSELDTRSTTQI